MGIIGRGAIIGMLVVIAAFIMLFVPGLGRVGEILLEPGYALPQVYWGESMIRCNSWRLPVLIGSSTLLCSPLSFGIDARARLVTDNSHAEAKLDYF